MLTLVDATRLAHREAGTRVWVKAGDLELRLGRYRKHDVLAA
ncbi:hypothetical protein [Microbacterium sp. ISL-103]|nr:hypothetical protein [Microbacterium sp. ISL-103]